MGQVFSMEELFLSPEPLEEETVGMVIVDL
jgi:hypothetical protein